MINNRFVRYFFGGAFLLYSGFQIYRLLTSQIDPETFYGGMLVSFFAWLLPVFAGSAAGFPLLMAFQAKMQALNEDGQEYQKTPLKENFVLPANVLEWELELDIRGFEYFGSYRAVHREKKAMNHTTTVYASSAKDIYAELIVTDSGKSALGFVTDFADGFQLNTLYNVALNADGEFVHSRGFSGSITEAYDYHVYQVGLQSVKHGDFITFETMESYINSPEKNKRIGLSVSQSVIRDNLKIARSYLLYVIPTFVGLGLAFIIPFLYADIIFTILVGLVFIFVDTGAVQSPHVAVDQAKSRKKQKAKA